MVDATEVPVPGDASDLEASNEGTESAEANRSTAVEVNWGSKEEVDRMEKERRLQESEEEQGRSILEDAVAAL